MLSGPPRPTEIEVSVFGPGVGESIVAHLGYGRWIVFDSCRDKTGACVPLAYLRSLDVDIARDVSDVVATHAHDDHIRGLAELLAAAESATFCVPTAATREEFVVALETDSELVDLRARVFAEFDEVWAKVHDRGRTWRRCGEGREIRQFPAVDAVPEVLIRALSPSDLDLDASLADLRRIIERLKDQTVKLSVRDPNHFAMAAWLHVGPVDVLLGSDVLTGDGAVRGWDGIVACYRGRFTAQLFKVAHHGSISGHHDECWSDLCATPLSVMTPFTKSGLPTASDQARVKSLSSRAFLTAKGVTPSSAQRAIAAGLQGTAQNLRWLPSLTGHVRARFDFGRNLGWRIELDHIATEVA